jgi:hypothetical protein
VSHSTPSEVQDLPPALPYPDSTIQHLAAGRAVKFQLSVIFNLMKICNWTILVWNLF